MTLENYKSEQAKISKEIERLKKQAVFLQNKMRQEEIASIVQKMKEYNILPKELESDFADFRDNKVSDNQIMASGIEAGLVE